MSGRRRAARVAAWTGALTLVAATSCYTVALARGCSGGGAPIVLDVAVAPELAPAAKTVGEDFTGRGHRVDGRCVRAVVRSAEPALTTALLSGRIPADSRNRRPDAWIPDSSLWVNRLPKNVATARPSLARAPIVLVAAGKPQARSASAPSWRDVLNKGTLQLPDPEREASGLSVLVLARTLLHGTPSADAAFAGMARKLRQSTVPDVQARLAASSGRSTLVAISEQALWLHNRQAKSGPAVAMYPREGTLSLDFPFVVPRAEPRRAEAAALLERAMRSESAQATIRSSGFRSKDGRTAASFGPGTGVNSRPPRALPAAAAGEVRTVAQAWSRLALGSRMLSLIDVSGSMATPVPGTRATRLQAIAEVSQDGLALQPDDTELGQWVFATNLKGRRDWRETVPLGPLGERVGSATRRQAILSALATLRPEPDGGTGLYDTLLAAFRRMTSSHRPEMINTILVFTDGRNDDADGPSLRATLTRLRAAYDPVRPVQIIVIGLGEGVDTGALRKITAVTHGGVYVAASPGDIRKIFQTAMARRLCAPDC